MPRPKHGENSHIRNILRIHSRSTSFQRREFIGSRHISLEYRIYTKISQIPGTYSGFLTLYALSTRYYRHASRCTTLATICLLHDVVC